MAGCQNSRPSSKGKMAKVNIVHPGPHNLRRGITPAIARQLLETTVAALKDAPGEFTLYLATHGAQLVKGNMGRVIICEAVFMQYAPRIQDMQIMQIMQIMTPEEAVEHWRITIAAPAAYITQSAQEARNETAQSTTGQTTLFAL